MGLQEDARDLVELIRLSTPPVGAAMLPGEPPAGVPSPEVAQRFCYHVNDARLNRRVLALRSDDMACPVGAQSLGFDGFPLDLAGFGRLGPRGAAQVAALPSLEEGSVGSVVIGPLVAMPVEPMVVLIVGAPAQVMRLVQAYGWVTGLRVRADLAGLAGICSEAVAQVAISGEHILTVLCAGARQSGGFTDNEMVYALPFSGLESLTDALRASAA